MADLTNTGELIVAASFGADEARHVRRGATGPVTVTATMGCMGRRSMGTRELLGTRMTPRLSDAVRASAKAEGLTVSDYIATVLARAVGHEEEAPALRRVPKNQESLPMTG